VAAPASRITVKAGPQAASSAVRPAPTARVQAACPLATPRAENTPPRRPAASVLRITSAVSWPGVTMTSADTATNRPKSASMVGFERSSVVG